MIGRVAGVMIGFMALTNPAPADELVPEPEGYRTEDYRAPVPDTLAGARVISTSEAAEIWRKKKRHLHRCAATSSKAGKPSTGDGLARQAALQHSRHHLAARYRLWSIGGGDRELSAARTYSRIRRRSRCPHRHILPGRLLDVVERGQTNTVIWLFERRLVSGRH